MNVTFKPSTQFQKYNKKYKNASIGGIFILRFYTYNGYIGNSDEMNRFSLVG
jgi:hypothetical protein